MKRLLVLLVLAFAPASVQADPPKTHEILSQRPSGFWTSNRPAVGGAYRWRLLALGVVIAGVTGYAIVRMIRRANAERQSQLK